MSFSSFLGRCPVLVSNVCTQISSYLWRCCRPEKPSTVYVTLMWPFKRQLRLLVVRINCLKCLCSCQSRCSGHGPPDKSSCNEQFTARTTACVELSIDQQGSYFPLTLRLTDCKLFLDCIIGSMTSERLSTKLRIQHPTEPTIQIVGILEQLAPTQPTQGRKIALVRQHNSYNPQRSVRDG